jgi:hypothetical protein
LIAGTLDLLRNFSLQDTKQRGQGKFWWFSKQDVDVLRHYDVASDIELVALAEGFQNFFEDQFRLRGSKEWESLITAEGDEVHVTGLLIAFEAEWHVGILVEPGGSGRASRDAHSSQKRDEWGTQCCG